MYALATSAGPRLAGAFIRNVQTLPWEPTSGATNTGTTVTLKAKALDPFRRAVYLQFQLDIATTFSSPLLQTSANVSGTGWPDTATQWTSAAIDNRTWRYRARTIVAALGAGTGFTGRYSGSVSFAQSGGAGIPRSLYLYVNKAATLNPVAARSLYLYVNKSVTLNPVAARSLYLYANRTIYPDVLSVAARSLYLYHSMRDGEVFPWLSHIAPTEQYVGGQVSLFGDGFGDWLEVAADPAVTVSVDSVNGSYVAANARDRSTGSWVSNSQAQNAWIRFTFPSSKRIVAVSLEGAGTAGGWGIPRFRFDDASVQTASLAVPDGGAIGAEYPCGATRRLYLLSPAKDTTYIEILGQAGRTSTFVGLYEVWVYELAIPAQAAETARAVLNLGLPSELDLGLVSWQNRSSGVYPANSGQPFGAAIVATVPSGAVSGLVYVEEAS